MPAGGAVDPRHDFLRAAPPDPAADYLASLGSAESRRTMTGTLDRLASLLTGRPKTATAAILHPIGGQLVVINGMLVWPGPGPAR